MRRSQRDLCPTLRVPLERRRLAQLRNQSDDCSKSAWLALAREMTGHSTPCMAGCGRRKGDWISGSEGRRGKLMFLAAGFKELAFELVRVR